MTEPTRNSIRFKRGRVEYELNGTAEAVSNAWTALESAVVAAFAADETPDETTGQASANLDEGAPPAKRRRKQKGQQTSSETRRDDTAQRLTAADLDTFPDLPNDPVAEYVGYATLDWARKQLDIDGLTVQQIASFSSKKLRLSIKEGAYREAFRRAGRALDRSDTRPQVFRLMNPGEQKLQAYFKKLKQGGTAKEAMAAGDEAERAAEPTT